MADASKKNNTNETEFKKQLQETSKGSILKHIPGVSEVSVPSSDEEIEEEEYLLNSGEACEECEKEEWDAIKEEDTEEEDEEDDDSSWDDSDDNDEMWDEEDEEWENKQEEYNKEIVEQRSELKHEYSIQEAELKKRFKEGG